MGNGTLKIEINFVVNIDVAIFLDTFSFFPNELMYKIIIFVNT